MAHEFPRRDHLLTPWLRQGESALVWAQSGVGKTLLTLTMALAVAGGGEFLEWRCATPRRVLVVDGEMHSEDLKERLTVLAGTVSGFDPEAAADNLLLMPRTWQKGGNVDFPDIVKPEGQALIIKEAQNHKADLVILDNFSTLADVVDENEAAAMSPVLTFLLRLKQDGIACILVHHAGKNWKILVWFQATSQCHFLSTLTFSKQIKARLAVFCNCHMTRYSLSRPQPVTPFIFRVSGYL